MNLMKKKELAAKVLGVGKNRILFVESSLPEIKEAITRQDIIELSKSRAIQIREISGRKKIVRRRHRRRTGKVKKNIKNRKEEYVIITRKLRKFLKYLLKTGKVDSESYRDSRKKIRARTLKSKRHLKEALGEL